MSRFRGIKRYDHATEPKAAVLLVNLGTPDAPDAKSLRRYLKEFLSDPRVVEIPRLIWLVILKGIILRTRPKKSAALYQSIWTAEGSPLLVFSEQQRDKVREKLRAQYGERVIVSLGMRYGNPAIEPIVNKLLDAGVQRLLVLPLYPQYSGSTSGSTFDAISSIMRKTRWIPELRFVSSYHDHPAYIAAMTAHIKRYWSENGRSPYLVFSFHGVPKLFLLNGDPYFCQCHKSARLLAAALELNDDQWQITFQSRFGKAEWLQPYTDKTMESLPAKSIRAVDVFCPGFSADCLETLEEIAGENKDIFMEAGGEQFRYIPALNAEDVHIEMMSSLIDEHTASWPEFSGNDDSEIAKQAAAAKQCAMALGADR